MFNFIKKIFLSEKLNSRKSICAVLLVATIFLVSPNISHGFFIDIAYTFIAKIAFGISWIIALIGGFMVGVIIVALQMILNISDGIVNSAPVQVGFPIILSVANLGFVTAIIAIAIGTILRSQTYNMKKMLANVVIMAVLVNFGLVISGAIIGFSNRVTGYFLDSMTGGNIAEFATIMAQTMNPQKAFVSLEGISITGTTTDAATTTISKTDQNALAQLGKGATNEDTKSIGSFLVPIISVFLTIATLVLMIITLAVLVFSFIMRYIKLTFALILLPGAWMASIFPSLKSWNGKWWDLFIKQAIYPPVVLFFLWLAMRVREDLANIPGLTFESASKSGGITEFLGNIVGVPLQGVMQAAVLAGLMLGGDYVAKSMGAAGAGAATKASAGMQKWAGGKVKTGLRRTGVAALDSRGTKWTTGKISSGLGAAGAALGGVGAGRGAFGKFISKPVRGLGGLVSGAGNAAERYAVRGKEQMSASASKSYKDDVAKMGDEELKIRAKAATGLELAAILDKASKNPKLMRGVIDNLPESTRNKLPADKDLYKRYGYDKAHDAAMLESGMTVKEKYDAFELATKKFEGVMATTGLTAEKREEAEKEFAKAEKEFTDSVKKLSSDGANGLLFAKEKGPDGKPGDKFQLDDKYRTALMQQLITKNGWNPGTFTDFLKKAQEGGNDVLIRDLVKDMDTKKIGPAFIKAMNNGAMKNLGIEGEDVFGEEKFREAKRINKVKDKGDRREYSEEESGETTTTTFE